MSTSAEHYGNGFRAARAIALARHPICQLCGAAAATVAHHWAVDYPPDDQITADDLTMLCKSCHGKAHDSTPRRNPSLDKGRDAAKRRVGAFDKSMMNVVPNELNDVLIPLREWRSGFVLEFRMQLAGYIAAVATDAFWDLPFTSEEFDAFVAYYLWRHRDDATRSEDTLIVPASVFQSLADKHVLGWSVWPEVRMTWPSSPTFYPQFPLLRSQYFVDAERNLAGGTP